MKHHLCQTSKKALLLDFTLNKLLYVIEQLSPQNRLGHRCFSSFSEYYFDIYIGRTRLRAKLPYLAGNSRLVLTCYKVNLLQSRDGSKSPGTLNKISFQQYLMAEEHSLLSQKSYFRCGKVHLI